MITKERLEELIKEEKYVWSTWGGEIKYMKPDEDYLTLGQRYLEQMFETEEDAKFALRFKRVPRTEHLDLPTWEEFYNSGKSVVFRDAYGDIQELKQYSREIYINEQCCGYLTKENYLKTCEICRKLWLGEEV